MVFCSAPPNNTEQWGANNTRSGAPRRAMATGTRAARALDAAPAPAPAAAAPAPGHLAPLGPATPAAPAPRPPAAGNAWYRRVAPCLGRDAPLSLEQERLAAKIIVVEQQLEQAVLTEQPERISALRKSSVWLRARLFQSAPLDPTQERLSAACLDTPETKRANIRRRQKRRKQLKPLLKDLFTPRNIPPELLTKILTYVGFDLAGEAN